MLAICNRKEGNLFNSLRKQKRGPFLVSHKLTIYSTREEFLAGVGGTPSRFSHFKADSRQRNNKKSAMTL